LIADVMTFEPEVYRGRRSHGLGQVKEATFATGAAGSVLMSIPTPVTAVAGAAMTAISSIMKLVGGQDCANPPCYARPGGDGYYSCTQSHDFDRVNRLSVGDTSWLHASLRTPAIRSGQYPAAPFPGATEKDAQDMNEYVHYYYMQKPATAAQYGETEPCPNYATAMEPWIQSHLPALVQKYPGPGPVQAARKLWGGLAKMGVGSAGALLFGGLFLGSIFSGGVRFGRRRRFR